MYKSMKEQRKKFIENLRANVSEYKENTLSDNPENLDAKKIQQDWEQVGAYIENSIYTATYDDLVKNLSNTIQEVIKKSAKKEYENEK